MILLAVVSAFSLYCCLALLCLFLVPSVRAIATDSRQLEFILCEGELLVLFCFVRFGYNVVFLLTNREIRPVAAMNLSSVIEHVLDSIPNTSLNV